MIYIVTAACVVVPDNTGYTHYRYQGAILRSDDYDSRAIERLLGRKMIEESDIAEPAEPEGGTGETVVVTEPGSAVERPKLSALKEAWVDYAVARGMSKDEAEALTRQDIAARFPEGD